MTPDDRSARPVPARRREPAAGDNHDDGYGSLDDDVYVVDTRARGRSGSREGRARERRPADQPRPAANRRETGAPGTQRGQRPARPEPLATGKASDGGRPPAAEPAPRTRHRARWVVLLVALLVAAWVAFMVWVPFHAWNAVAKVDTTPAGQRPADSKGYDFLLVGSDSRAGLSAEQKKDLTTGSAVGKRTDSIILVHVPADGGKPVLVSIPRDSYMPIPGHASNKVNAAYTIGGPKLLVRTVEQVTRLHLDGYVEIGFGGFASVVDSLGGVDMCVPFAMKDAYAGINLAKGCQTLTGPQALGYVRARYSDPRGDIGRAERQRQFLGAVMKKAATPATVLVPTRYYRFSMAAGRGLTVGEDTSLRDVSRVLLAMRAVSRDQGLSLVVPIQSLNYQTRAGSSIKWDTPRAQALFTALRNDTPLEAPPPGTDGKPSGQ